VKLIVIGAAWLYAHHFFAGIRYLLLDLHIGIEKAARAHSAVVVLVLGVAHRALRRVEDLVKRYSKIPVGAHYGTATGCCSASPRW
jgi:hypothetical protein